MSRRRDVQTLIHQQKRARELYRFLASVRDQPLREIEAITDWLRREHKFGARSERRRMRERG